MLPEDVVFLTRAFQSLKIIEYTIKEECFCSKEYFYSVPKIFSVVKEKILLYIAKRFATIPQSQSLSLVSNCKLI